MSYISRRPRPARAFEWWEEPVGPTQITVHEDDSEPEWTGLLDQHGNELYRVRDKPPMGFRLK